MKTTGPTRERVTTIGEGGKRFWLYPAKFSGEWVKRRRWVAAILILIFFITPWTKVGGRQTILLDVAERKFAFFGLVLWPQDTLVFWFFLAGTVVLIFYITAQWGRLWCGWACPQTVFLEHVFRRIEIWIEGDAKQRRRLDQSPMSWEKFRKKGLKYLIFLIISSHFANTVLCYFVGTDQVLEMTFHAPSQNWGWFTFMAFFNFLFFVDFAWFREQFCIIACPYGRFQSVLLDKESLAVTYDYNRGEPRGVLRKGEKREIGDCIDCNRCVAVCPTGIDIRQGQQMECINCTACMDACDEIMDKVKKPRGLIRYDSIAGLEGRARKFFRPRTIAYSALLLFLFGMGIFWFNTQRGMVIRMLRPPGGGMSASQSSDIVSNLFQTKVVNRADREYELTVEAPKGYEVILPLNPWKIGPGETAETRIFVRKPTALFDSDGKETITISFYDKGQLIYDKEVTILGPQQ